MPAYIVEHVSGGRVRTCGSRCAGARSAKCRCVCGGVNHGQALRQLKLPLEPSTTPPKALRLKETQ